MLSRNIERFGIQHDALLICFLLENVAVFGCAIYSEYRYNTEEHILSGHFAILYKFYGDIKEPFATSTNICHFSTSFAITIFTYFHGKYLHPGIYVSMTLSTILAALSWAYHSTGSLIGSWQHHGDRYAMFAILTWLTAFNCITLYNTFSPIHTSILTKLVGLVTFFGGQIAMSCIIIDQREFATESILLTLGFTAFTPTALISWRQTYCSFGKYKLIKSFIYSVYTTMTPVLVFGLGYMYQRHAESLRRCTGCILYNPDYYDVNTEQMSKYDMFHGVWHYLSSLCIALIACLQADQVQGTIPTIKVTLTRIFPHIFLWGVMFTFLVLFYEVNAAKQLRDSVLAISSITSLGLCIVLYFRTKEVLRARSTRHLNTKDDTDNMTVTDNEVSDRVEVNVVL